MKMIVRNFFIGNNSFSGKSLIFSTSSQLLLLIGFGGIFAGIVFGQCGGGTVAFGLFTVSLTIFFILSPFLAIIGNLILFHKTRKAKAIVILIAELAVLLLIGLRCIPYLYASPALSPKKLDVYNRFIEFSSQVNWRQSFHLGYSSVSIDDVSYNLNPPELGLSDLFSDSEIVELRSIHRALKKMSLRSVTRRGEWVYFYRMNTPYRPLSSGVLYSMNGNNPNDSNIDEIKEKGPYVPIDGNWYASELLTKYHRTAFPLPVTRQSLIDRSLPKEIRKKLRGAETIQFGPR